MSKTWLCVISAAVLVAISLGIFVARRSVLGPESSGPLSWQIAHIVEGTLEVKDASVSIVRPLDFRRQHISEERFHSGKELCEPTRLKRADQRLYTWRRQVDAGAPEPFRLEYAFRCTRQRPTPTMERWSKRLDEPPAPEAFLESTPQIQAKDERLSQTARALSADDETLGEQARRLFDFVADLSDQAAPNSQTALGCLQNFGGDALGKARLLAALCRNRGIQARIMTGLVLAGQAPAHPHHWLEAWLEDHWLTMDPTHGKYAALPENYVVYRVGDGPIVSSSGARVHSRVHVESTAQDGADWDDSPSPAKRFWRKVDLKSLHITEQHVAEFLLLLPLAALIVSIARTIIGIRTFGVFAPALIGLAFLDRQALIWALPIFTAVVLAGWGMRHLLERYHLLQVPRVSAMLTLVIIFLLVMIVTASNFGVTATRYVSLFPLVILTFLVERFWTIEAEDSTAESFKTLLGTLAVASVVSLSLGLPAVRTWMFHYPETLGAVLAILMLLGRYTGYRLTELYRFQDLLQEESHVSERPSAHALNRRAEYGLAQTLAAAEPTRRSRHESP